MKEQMANLAQPVDFTAVETTNIMAARHDTKPVIVPPGRKMRGRKILSHDVVFVTRHAMWRPVIHFLCNLWTYWACLIGSPTLYCANRRHTTVDQACSEMAAVSSSLPALQDGCGEVS
jgi:hypothetical protein